MKRHVGIEAMGLAIPARYIDIEDLARARGVDPAKYTSGLGALEMAVADPGEDTVALAATAAGRLLRQNDVDPAQIGMLVVGTETGVDHSKTVASHVQGLLGLPRAMRTFDVQHACYGGTAGLMALVGLAGLAGAWLFGAQMLRLVFGPAFVDSQPFLLSGSALAVLLFANQIVQLTLATLDRPNSLVMMWLVAVAVAVPAISFGYGVIGAHAGPAGLAAGLLAGWLSMAFTRSRRVA